MHNLLIKIETCRTCVGMHSKNGRSGWNHAILDQEKIINVAHHVEILDSLCYLEWLGMTLKVCLVG